MPRGAVGTAGPDIALFIKLDLAGEGDPGRHWDLDQPLGLGIEAPDRVIASAADPDDALGINVERVGDLIVVVRKCVGRPLLRLGIESAQHA